MPVENNSEFLYHAPCPSCGSSDANSVFSDGHQWCFACNNYEHGDEDMPDKPTKEPKELLSMELPTAWRSRGITAASAQKWGLGVAKLNGKSCRVFPYRDETGALVAQKVRPAKKDDMRFLNGSNKLLFGRHLWGGKGKMLVITEGELDAVSISQLQAHKWPVVSVPTGSKGARKALQENLEWISGYETVVLYFDADTAGREAVTECAPLFKPGQVKIATLDPYKDANEALVAGEGKAIISAIWQAKPWRPDGIVAGLDLKAELLTKSTVLSQAVPWKGLQEKTLGIRPTELWTLCAGSGVGKSAVVREFATHVAGSGHKVGMLMLEETVQRSAMGLVGIQMDQNLLTHADPTQLEGFDTAIDEALKNVVLYDHFGSTSLDNILDRIRYMAMALECKYVFLDHLSILISGMQDGDERRLIDNAMTSLKTLCMETGIGMVLVSHLRRPDKKGHEEGAVTSLSQLRGSHAIAQLSDTVIGLERDQQSTSNPNTTTVRVLKNRWTGMTGIAGHLGYNHGTGRLTEVDAPGDDDDSPF